MRPPSAGSGSLVAIVTFTLAACATLVQPAPTPKAPYTLAPPTPTLSPLATVGPTGHGQPYRAPDLEPYVAAAHGIPDSVHRLVPAIADALAERVWTYDGRPYRRVSVLLSCDEDPMTMCEISLDGLPAFGAVPETADSWWFRLDLRSGSTVPTGEALHAFPPELEPGLDALARSLDEDGRLAGHDLRAVTWSPPPPANAYVLRYQQGDLEGAHVILVTVDGAEGRLLSFVVEQAGEPRPSG